jgi:hypothetical protein
MSRFGSSEGAWGRSAVPLLALLLLALLLAAFAEPLSGILTRRVVDSANGVLAGCAGVLLLVDVALRRQGQAHRWRGARDSLLVALALGSALAWWNFGQLHYPHYVHYSDTYHYYLGSKYFPELGYTRLYACAAVADAEAGPGTGVADRDLRNLATNRLESTSAVLADPDGCKRHFSAARWRSFAHDVAWFRERVPRSRWHAMQRDHGYNPPPSWGALGSWLANLGPASDLQIHALAALDPVLLALMWVAVGWAFGRRALCVAVIYWGTNLFGVFGWTGGAFLRQVWLAAAIGGICCLRRDRPAAGGALLTLATLLRIFPGTLLLAVAVGAAWKMGRERRATLAAAHRRLLAGGLAAAGLIVALSLVGHAGGRPWFDFVANSRLHLTTPLKNHVGLRTLIAYDSATVERRIQGDSAVERYRIWRDARLERFGEREFVYWTLLAGYIALLAFAVRDQPDWVAAVLGIGLIPVAFELTNYYYAILLGFGLLAARHAFIAAALCGVAALSWAIVDLLHWQDEILTGCSAMVVLFVVFCAAWVLRERSNAANGDVVERSTAAGKGGCS